MYIRYISDVHLEVDSYFYIYNDVNPCDLLIIAGDLFPANYFLRSEASPYFEDANTVRKFFKHVSEQYKHVIYIPGNHEHYAGNLMTTDQVIESEISKFDNIHYLQNKVLHIDDIKFIGGTLWTNIYNSDPVACMSVRYGLNDYRSIKNGNRKLIPEDTIQEHYKTLDFFKGGVAGHDKVVIISHHAPSRYSVHSKYHNDYYINSAYYSDLDNFILDNPQIKLWVHGHMHNNFDYSIGCTRVVCNPRGYGRENKDGFQYHGVVEV